MKTQERTIKELLIILRNNLKESIELNLQYGGMCAVIYHLRNNIISVKESMRLALYLEQNRPESANERLIKYDGQNDELGFGLARHWWPPRAIKPRIKWLNEQIAKL